MHISRVKSNFHIISNQVLQDNRLSWKARGIFCYLWSLPEYKKDGTPWEFYQSEIAKHSSDSMYALRTGLHELEHYHYLSRHRLRKENGYFGDDDWKLNDHPITKPKSDSPMFENHTYGNQIYGNRTLYNRHHEKVNTRNNRHKTAREKKSNVYHNLSHNQLEHKANELKNGKGPFDL